MTTDLEAEKQTVAAHAVTHVRDNMIVGLGSGTTSRYFVNLLAKRVKTDHLSIVCVATSIATSDLANQSGLVVKSLDDVQQVDLYVDGVDEISDDGAIIKGGGGALLREKIIAANAKQRIYIADSSKLVTTLGKFPLPVEVVQFGHSFTARKIEKLGARTSLRPSLTDSGNFIYDCKFDSIPNPVALDRHLHQIPGVVETGLFLDLDGILITIASGSVIERPT